MKKRVTILIFKGLAVIATLGGIAAVISGFYLTINLFQEKDVSSIAFLILPLFLILAFIPLRFSYLAWFKMNSYRSIHDCCGLVAFVAFLIIYSIMSKADSLPGGPLLFSALTTFLFYRQQLRIVPRLLGISKNEDA